MAYQSRRASGFNPYAVGNKIYGGGRSAPNVGPVNDKMGYKERDLQAKGRRAAVLRRMKARKSNRFMSADNLRGSV
jgi:hypothetical protein